MRIVLSSVFLFTVALINAHAQEVPKFYIAPNGNDAWSGRLPEPNAEKADGPWATIPGAKAAVREILKNNGVGAVRPMEILIREGT